ncbi:MAG: lysylphosphatidylglycerol synthase transmembrane domain-containing protein, partial [Chloroflexota bacterium]
MRPKILIPVVLSAALIIGLVAFTDPKKLVTVMEGFHKLDLLYVLLLLIAYAVVRGTQWHFLLISLGFHLPIKTQVFAFTVGEMAKSLPIGNYFQNYLLQQSKGTDFGRTSAATTVIVLTEVAVSLVGVVILGVGTWTSWLRPVIVIGLVVFLVGAWTYHKLHHSGRAPRWIREHKAMVKVMDEFQQFKDGAADLFHPRILAIEALLSTTYLFCGGAALYVVVRGLGVGTLSFWQVLAVYFFSLAFSLIFPLPVDIGVLEASAVGAFLA